MIWCQHHTGTSVWVTVAATHHGRVGALFGEHEADTWRVNDECDRRCVGGILQHGVSQ